jgi:hypothetical protein
LFVGFRGLVGLECCSKIPKDINQEIRRIETIETGLDVGKEVVDREPQGL